MEGVTMEQGTKEWEEFRSNKIGSSDAAAIMGVSKYRNIYDLYLEKTDPNYVRPDLPEFVIKKGEAFEDLALLDLEDKTKLIWVRQVFVSDDNPLWMASLDGHNTKHNMLWECKYVGKDRFSKFCNPYLKLKDRLGEDYYAQYMHQFLVNHGFKMDELLKSFGYFTMVIDHAVAPDFIAKGKQVFKHIKHVFSLDDYRYLEEEYLPRLRRFTNAMVNKDMFDEAQKKQSEQFKVVADEKLEALIKRYAKQELKLKDNKSSLDNIKKCIFEISLEKGDKIIVNGNKISKSLSVPKKTVDYELLVRDNVEALKGIDFDMYKRFSTPRETKRISISSQYLKYMDKV